MSGGSYDYTCFKIENEYCGKMYDAELDEMMQDIADLTYDLEWWISGDKLEEEYRNKANEFKKKWFGPRDERLIAIVEAKCEELKTELLKMIGEKTC